MDIYPAENLAERRGEIAERLRLGQVAIFPTDTIYGLTADARIDSAVDKILTIKRRQSPISCIPYDRSWAAQLIISEAREHFDRLTTEYAGTFTMLWPSTQADRRLHPQIQTSELVGLRFPEHWITEFAHWAQIPLTTTSVNRSSDPPMTCLDDLDPEIRDEVDFCVDSGALSGSASTIVLYENGQMTTLRER